MTMFCTMGLTSNTFSIYINAFIEENGFTQAQGASLSTIRCIASLIGTMITGIYYEKLNMKKGLSLSVLMIALSFFLYSMAHTLSVFYIGAFIAGLGYGLGTMVPVTMMIHRWFAEKQGFALGFASAGSGLATIICPPLMTAGLRAGGVAFAASVEGALILAYAVIMFFLLKNHPKEKGLQPYGLVRGISDCNQTPSEQLTDTENNEPAPPSIPDKGKSSLSRAGDILLLLALFLLGATTTPSSESLAVHLSTGDVSPELTAAAVSVYGLFMTGGKFIYGFLVDVIGSFKTNYIFTAVLVSGFFAGYFADGKHIIITFLFVACMGFGFAMTTVGISVWALHFYSGARATAAVRHFWIATLTGSLTFTTIPGIFADIWSSYRLYYALSGLLFIVVMSIIQGMYIKQKKQEVIL